MKCLTKAPEQAAINTCLREITVKLEIAGSQACIIQPLQTVARRNNPERWSRGFHLDVMKTSFFQDSWLCGVYGDDFKALPTCCQPY